MKTKKITLPNGNKIIHSKGILVRNSYYKYIRYKDIFANYIGIYLRIYIK